jgi:hypothetical protein
LIAWFVGERRTGKQANHGESCYASKEPHSHEENYSRAEIAQLRTGS